MADPTDGFAMSIVMLLNSLPRDQAERTLRAATASYYLSGSETLDEGICRLTTFAGIMQQVSMHHAHGNTPESIERARERLREFRNG